MLPLLLALILTPIIALAQHPININAGQLVIPANTGYDYFEAPLNQNVTSFSIAGPRPEAHNSITVLFVQDATGGRTVTGYASNILNTSTIAIDSTAGSSTLVAFSFDQPNNTWVVSNTSSVIAQVDLTGQTASVPLTTLFTPASAGEYELSAQVFFTNPTGASTVEVDYEFTQNSADSGVLTLAFGSVNAANVTAGSLNKKQIIYADAGTPIKWALTYTSGGTGDSYDVHLRLEKLQ